MGDAQRAIENGLDPFMSSDGVTPWEETELGYNPIYYDEPELDDFDYEERLDELKIRLVEIEINIKKLNNEKEDILNELIVLMEENLKLTNDKNIIEIDDDELPF
jgi:hypothetical protein